MRLVNTATLEYEEFLGDGTPKYAILSHRWESEEVMFEELHSPAARKKKGYFKIIDFCDEVRSRGYDHAWIDTCCINKKDSTELAEAINSMFVWYKNSHTCVTYLSDFTLRPEMSQNQFEYKLARSQWFGRGWTLQELIAPANVEFYDSNWRFIGTKRNLAGVISRITGINKDLLQGKRTLRSFSCAQKMSWAANRRTTRPEDRSYSLLGLFGISLPLIYDGDGPRAFKRLQDEIIKHSNDQSIFAWVEHGSSRSFRNEDIALYEKCSVLAPSPECFRFSSNIVSLKWKESDRPYSLTNGGLEITQQIRPVRNSGSRVLLEVLLNCCYEGREDSKISILAAATSWSFKLHTSINRLPTSRVCSHFLGPVSSRCLSRSQIYGYVWAPLQISPTYYLDLAQTGGQYVSWMKGLPSKDAETEERMELARENVQNLYAKSNDKLFTTDKYNTCLWIAAGLFGAYTLGKELKRRRANSENDNNSNTSGDSETSDDDG